MNVDGLHCLPKMSAPEGPLPLCPSALPCASVLLGLSLSHPGRHETWKKIKNIMLNFKSHCFFFFWYFSSILINSLLCCKFQM